MKFGDEAEKEATEEITEDKEIIGLAQEINSNYRNMKGYVWVECKFFAWISFQKNHDKKSRAKYNLDTLTESDAFKVFQKRKWRSL